MTPRTLHLANLLLAAALLAASMLAWPHLPERIPTHFDLAGTPTTWTRTSRLAWYGLPWLAVVMAALLWVAGRWGRAVPWLWNVPEKDRFLKLSPAAREPFVAELDSLVALTGVAMTLAFAGVQASMYLTAAGRMRGMPGALLALVLLPTAAAVVVAVRRSLRMGPRIRAAADAEGIPPPRWR
jgi:uncharacterized membrane protein